jgi:hypothetical protein
VAFWFVLVVVAFKSSEIWLAFTLGGLSSVALSDFIYEGMKRFRIIPGEKHLRIWVLFLFPFAVFVASTIGSKLAEVLYNQIYSGANSFKEIEYGTLFLGTWNIGNWYPIISLGWLVPILIIGFVVSLLVYSDLYFIQVKSRQDKPPFIHDFKAST